MHSHFVKLRCKQSRLPKRDKLVVFTMNKKSRRVIRVYVNTVSFPSMERFLLNSSHQTEMWWYPKNRVAERECTSKQLAENYEGTVIRVPYIPYPRRSTYPCLVDGTRNLQSSLFISLGTHKNFNSSRSNRNA